MADPQTAAFDVQGARSAGYSDDEIAQHMAQSRSFDLDGARKAGYSSTDVIQHLSSSTPAAKPAAATSDEDLARQTTAKWVQENQSKNQNQTGQPTEAGHLGAKVGKWFRENLIEPFQRSGTFAGEYLAAGERAAQTPEWKQAAQMPMAERVGKTALNVLENVASAGAVPAARVLFSDNPESGTSPDPVQQAHMRQTAKELSDTMLREAVSGEKTPDEIKRVYQGASDAATLIMPASRTASAVTKPLEELGAPLVTRMTEKLAGEGITEAAGRVLPKVEGLMNAEAAEKVSGQVASKMGQLWKTAVSGGGQFAAYNFKYERGSSTDVGEDIQGRAENAMKGFGLGFFAAPALKVIGEPILKIAQARIAGAWAPVAEWWAGKGVEQQVQKTVMKGAVNEMVASGLKPSEWVKAEVENLGLQTKALTNGLRGAMGDLETAIAKPATVGTAEGAAADTAHFQRAKQELGPDASMSDVARKAQEFKDQAAAVPKETSPAFKHYANPAFGQSEAFADAAKDAEKAAQVARAKGNTEQAEKMERIAQEHWETKADYDKQHGLTPEGQLARDEAGNVTTTGTYGEEAKAARADFARARGGTVNISVGAMRAAKIGIAHLTGRLQAVEGIAADAGFSEMSNQAKALREGLNGVATLFHSMSREWGLIGQELQRPLSEAEVRTGGEALQQTAQNAKDQTMNGKFNDLLDKAMDEYSQRVGQGKAGQIRAARQPSVAQLLAKAMDVEGAVKNVPQGTLAPTDLERRINSLTGNASDVTNWVKKKAGDAGKSMLELVQDAIDKRQAQKMAESTGKTANPARSVAGLVAKAQDVEAAAVKTPTGQKLPKTELDKAIESMTVSKADLNGWLKSLDRVGKDVEMLKPGAQHSSLYQSVMGPNRLQGAMRLARMGMLSLTSPIGAGLHSSAWALSRMGEAATMDIYDRATGSEADRLTNHIGAMVRSMGRGTAADLEAGFTPVSRRVGAFLRESFGALKTPAAVLGESTAQPIVGKTVDKFLFPHIEGLGRMSSIFGDFAYETGLHDAALKAGQGQNLKGMALTSFVRDAVAKPSQEMMDHATQQMKMATFRRDMPRVVEDLTRSPLATLFINPFTHFGAQALRLFSEFTVTSPDFWSKVVNNKATGEDLVRFATRNLEGISGVYAVNRLLYDRVDFNRMEYVREDGKRISLRGTTPVVDLLAVAAALRGDYASATRAAGAGVMMFPTSGGVLAPILEAVKNGISSKGRGFDGSALLTEMNRLIASTYPGNKVLGAINSLISKDVKAYSGPFGAFAKTPGLSTLANPQIDPTTGQPQQSNRQFAGTDVSSPDIGARGVQQNLPPVDRMLAELGFSRITPRGPRLLDPESLEPGQQPKPYQTPGDIPENMKELYEQNRGQMMNQILAPLAGDQRFRAMPFALQQKIVKKAIAKVDIFARKVTNLKIAQQHGKQLAVPEETPANPEQTPGINPLQNLQDVLQLDRSL